MSTKKKYNNFDMTLEECKLVFDHIGQLVVVDETGKIKYMSEAILEFIEYFDRVDLTDSVGKNIRDFFLISSIPEVLATGKEDYEHFYFSGGEINIARITPLYKDGKIVGAIDYDLFTEEKDFRRFFDKVMDYSLKGYIDLSKMRELMKRYDESVKYKYTVGDIIGESPPMEQLRKQIYGIASTDASVLIMGETGCGKEMVAHSIHGLGRRGTSNLVIINCAAIPDTLVESELFGYEEGAFTGAVKGGKAGKFEQANNGTIFLDEVDQLPQHVQPKLLRVLQEKEIERIGGNERIPVNVRVIAATNKGLKELVFKGKFREDLYYRLNVMEVRIPPLRERKEDLPLLANHHIRRLNLSLERNVTSISKEALEMMSSYDWPGNVRELHNILERAMNKCRESELKLPHFDDFFIEISRYNVNKTLSGGSARPLDEIRDIAEKEAIINALRLCNGNISRAAQLLKISRPSLYDKLKKHKISHTP